MTTPIEVELKLELPPAAVPQLRKLPLIRAIEAATGRKAQIEQAKGPLGDVRETYADITKAVRDFGFAPRVALADGIAKFVDWYKTYFRV